MATATPLRSPDLIIPPPPPAPPRNLRRAFELMRQVRDDPAQTELGLQLVEALGGFGTDDQFRAVALDPVGRRLLRDRPSLVALLADREALAAMPDGSFGRAYLAFAERNSFAADGLIELRGQAESTSQRDPYRTWFSDRMTVVHDLQHVLTGYGTDPVGESAILWFTRGLGVNGPALRFLTTMSMLFTSWPVKRLLWQAWRRGRRCEHLAAVPYEELLPQPLSTVRCELGIGAPRHAHPQGVLAEIDGEVVVAPAAA